MFLLLSDPTFYKWGRKIMICDAFFPNSVKTPLNPLDYFAFSYLTISITGQVT